MTEPLRGSWFADPLVLDSSFQLLILWSFEQYQAGSLPVAAGRYRQYRAFGTEDEVEIQVSVVERSGSLAKARIEFVDMKDGSLIARIDDYECVIDGSLNQTFLRNITGRSPLIWQNIRRLPLSPSVLNFPVPTAWPGFGRMSAPVIVPPVNRQRGAGCSMSMKSMPRKWGKPIMSIRARPVSWPMKWTSVPSRGLNSMLIFLKRSIRCSVCSCASGIRP